MKYIDFVDLKHKPAKTDIICTFYVEPKGISLKEAAGGVAAESSIGTWTELTTEEPYVAKLAARVFSIEGNLAKICYPIELFEEHCSIKAYQCSRKRGRVCHHFFPFYTTSFAYGKYKGIFHVGVAKLVKHQSLQGI